MCSDYIPFWEWCRDDTMPYPENFYSECGQRKYKVSNLDSFKPSHTEFLVNETICTTVVSRKTLHCEVSYHGS